MFVEQLTKEDLINFISEYEQPSNIQTQYDFTAITKYISGGGRISFSINDTRFRFSDFDFTTNHMTSLQIGVHNNNWLKFMHEKFGNSYKIAFLVHREHEKKKVLEDAEKKYNSDTKKYLRNFNSNKSKSLKTTEEKNISTTSNKLPVK